MSMPDPRVTDFNERRFFLNANLHKSSSRIVRGRRNVAIQSATNEQKTKKKKKSKKLILAILAFTSLIKVSIDLVSLLSILT